MYGCLASPSERAYTTINDSPEATPFSWEITTTPVPVSGFKPSALLVINSTEADAAKLTAFEDILYGANDVAARMPLPDEVLTLLAPTAG